MYRIKIFESRPEPDVAGYLPAYPAGTENGAGYCDGCCNALHDDEQSTIKTFQV